MISFDSISVPTNSTQAEVQLVEKASKGDLRDAALLKLVEVVHRLLEESQVERLIRLSLKKGTMRTRLQVRQSLRLRRLRLRQRLRFRKLRLRSLSLRQRLRVGLRQG